MRLQQRPTPPELGLYQLFIPVYRMWRRNHVAVHRLHNYTGIINILIKLNALHIGYFALKRSDSFSFSSISWTPGLIQIKALKGQRSFGPGHIYGVDSSLSGQIMLPPRILAQVIERYTFPSGNFIQQPGIHLHWYADTLFFTVQSSSLNARSVFKSLWHLNYLGEKKKTIDEVTNGS